MIARMLGASRAAGQIGAAVAQVSEVFRPNATRRMALDNKAYLAALDQYGQEYRQATSGRFDQLMNGVNRLPRPALALGTIGLFVYAMVAPQSFSLRMQGLALVPQPLWWLLGAIVSFYFGAREMSYRRAAAGASGAGGPIPLISTGARVQKSPPPARDRNAALDEWQAGNDR